MTTARFGRATAGAFAALALLASPAGADQTRDGPLTAGTGAAEPPVHAAAPAATGWQHTGQLAITDAAVATSSRMFNGSLTEFNSAYFVAPDGRMAHVSFDGHTPTPNPPRSLGGDIYSTPAVAVRQLLDGNGTEEDYVFARGSDEALFAHRGGGSGWLSLGGRSQNAPIAVGDAAGRVHVFAVGIDDALWHNVLVGGPTSWQGWRSLGGQIVGDPAAEVSPFGIEVTAVGVDSALYSGRITGDATFSGWLSRGGVVDSYPWMAATSEGTWAFAVGADAAMWVNRLTPAGQWTGWQPLGGFVISGPGTVVTTGDQLTVLAVGGDGAAYSQVVSAAGGQGWRSLGGFVISNIFGAPVGDTARIFAVGGDGQLYYQTL